MLYRKWFTMLSLFVIAALLLSACQPIQAPAGIGSPSDAPQVLIAGAPIQGASGLAFGPDGNLYVASNIGRQIVALNSDTGEVVKRLGRAEKVELPWRLTFGPDGSLYWSSFPGVEVQVGRLAPDGTSDRIFSLPQGDWPIFVSPEGRLYVGQTFLSEGLYELDPQFKELPRSLHSPLTGIGSYTYGPDGLVYVCNLYEGQVLRFDLANEDFETEVVVDSATFPFATAFDSKGGLLLLHSPSRSGDEISLVDSETGALQRVLTWTSGIDDFVIDSQDQVYFSDPFDGAIYKLLTDGTVRTLSPGGLTSPGGIAVAPGTDGESVYVAGFHQMREYDGATGELLRHEWANGAYPAESITHPQTVAPFGDNLMLASWWLGNGNIQLWDPKAHKQIKLIEGIDPGPAEVIEFEGAIVFTPAGSGQVMRIDPDKGYAIEQASRSFFWNPVGLAAKDGDLYVGDFRDGTVSQIAHGGEFMDKPVVVAQGLEGPEGIDFAPDGRLLVVETKVGRLTAIDLTNGETATIADGFGFDTDYPPGMPVQWLLNDVAVGPSGTIYVTGDNPAALYRIPPLSAVSTAAATDAITP